MMTLIVFEVKKKTLFVKEAMNILKDCLNHFNFSLGLFVRHVRGIREFIRVKSLLYRTRILSKKSLKTGNFLFSKTGIIAKTL